MINGHLYIETMTSHNGGNDILSDPGSKNWQYTLANGWTPTSCINDVKFQQDSIVPSTEINSLALIPCGGNTKVVHCSSFATCPAGCLDLIKIMTAAASGTAIQNDIITRYPTAQCATDLSTQILANYNNWHLKRMDPSTGVPSVTANWQTTKTSIINTLNGLSDASDSIGKSIAAWPDNIPAILNQTNGLIAGMSCVSLAEDLKLLKNNFCVYSANNVDAQFNSLLVIWVLMIPFLWFYVILLRKEHLRRPRH